MEEAANSSDKKSSDNRTEQEKRTDGDGLPTEYAIVQHGGKQYQVWPGSELIVERAGALGDDGKLEFTKVLARRSSKDGVEIGTPLIDGASISAEVIAEEKGPKLVAYKKKRRQGYQRKLGHRQKLLRVKVGEL